jgi:pilus assembly protein Flp/PilA
MSLSIRRWGMNQSGATAIEYGLIAALVSVAAIVALQAMGTSLGGMFTNVADKLSCAATSKTSTGGACP